MMSLLTISPLQTGPDKEHKVRLGTRSRDEKYASPSYPRSPSDKGPTSQQIAAVISQKHGGFLGFVKGRGSGPRGWGSAKARTLLRPWRPGTAKDDFGLRDWHSW